MAVFIIMSDYTRHIHKKNGGLKISEVYLLGM